MRSGGSPKFESALIVCARGGPATRGSENAHRGMLQAAVDWAATEGYGLVGGIGEYEDTWRMAYVRGPEGILVSLFERLG